MKKLLFCLIVVIFSCNKVYALECNSTDRERLQKFADNITYTLEEYQKDGEIYFKVTFTGLSKDLSIYNDKKNLYYYNFTDNDFGEFELKPLYVGETYKFVVYGNYKCTYDKFKIITINVPSINVYYGDPICENAKEYKLCQKWEKVNISYEEFINKVNKYIEQKHDKPNDKPNIKNNKDSFDFLDIYNKYYWPTFIVMICLLILLIILWIRQNRKNKL